MKCHQQRWTKWTLGISTVLALGLGWPTGAQAQTFRACFVPQVGAMYLIDLDGLPTECLATDHEEISWSEEAGAGGAATHAELTGLTSDDHPQYMLAEGERRVTEAFSLTGTLNRGNPPNIENGPRIMWYPGKAAFRVGVGSIGSWSDQNIGHFSFAAGATPTASGQSAVAIGSGAIASATGGIAMGTDAQATGEQSTAVGQSTLASGLSSTAIGRETVASGAFSLAAGLRTEAGGTSSVALGDRVSTNGLAGVFVFGDRSGIISDVTMEATKGDQFAVRAQHFWLGSTPTITSDRNFLDTSTGAFLSTGGTWTDASSREWKEGFVAVDPAEVLTRVMALPISEWNYKVESDSVRHIGPVAEDFYAAFGLGSSEQHIASLDGVGVSLAAIKALAVRVERLELENAELRAVAKEPGH